jgi:hypothetical protein
MKMVGQPLLGSIERRFKKSRNQEIKKTRKEFKSFHGKNERAAWD